MLSRVTGPLALVLVGCGGTSSLPWDGGIPPDANVIIEPDAALPPVSVDMDFTRAGGLFSAPFPSDDLLKADGTPDLSLFPNPRHVPLIDQGIHLLANTHGFAQAGGVFFRLTGPIDKTTLPDLAGSTAADARVFLVGIDPDSPDYLRRMPVTVSFEEEGVPYGDANLLGLVPLQGIPLRPHTAYAAVVLTSVLDASGRPLAHTATPPENPTYLKAAYALSALSIDTADVAGVAAYTTAGPSDDMGLFRAAILARPLPAPNTALTFTGEVYDDYCVYSSTIDMPDYQSGVSPFDSEGGDWLTDSDGQPIYQRDETAKIYVTVPRLPPPPGGYPTLVFARQGSGDRGLIDRGVQDASGATAGPGTGPAVQLGQAGFAGVQVDGPVTGLRNPNGADEQYLLFNFMNADALRDNIRESALELILIAHIVPTLEVDASECPGVGAPVTFDGTHLAILGHSNGAWVAPIAVSYEPMYKAAILSGAGGSYIANIMYKQKPLDVKNFAELIIGYAAKGYSLTPHDPLLTLVQWALEPSDPQVYDRRILVEPEDGAGPRHILMEQGIVDHYIMPPIADATSLGIGLDLAGPALDATAPELSIFTPVEELMPLVGRGRIDLPATGNYTTRDGIQVTAVVVQHPEDGVEDGHEIIFQTEAPKREYRCFLASFASGLPSVPAPSASGDPSCK